MARSSKMRLLVIMALVLAAQGFAQKPSTSLTKRDERNIYAQADATLRSFIEKLNFVSDPEASPGDLDESISQGFSGKSRIFYDAEFEVDDDTDPGVDPKDAHPKGIRDYLRQWRNFYKQSDNGSVSITITDHTPIRIGQTNLFLKVFYTENLSGKDVDGKPFPKKIQKVAELQVLNVAGQWQTYINKLSFAAKADASAGAPVVTITDKGSDDASKGSSGAGFSDSYYARQLAAGIRAMGENAFTDAFFALREAKNNPATSEEADKRIEELYSKMRAQNQEPIKTLYDGLFSSGRALQDKFRYSPARRHYEYAREERPLNSAAVSAALTELGAAERFEADLSALVEKGSYNDAFTRYRGAIERTPYNPALYVGLARACEGLGRMTEAEEAFAKAVSIDASFPDTYRWQARFYQRQKNFPRAYAALVDYQLRAEDPDERSVLSDIAYCKGMCSTNPTVALDSMRAALNHNPDNRDAMLGQADLLRGQHNLKEAKKIIAEAIDRDIQYADAYYLQGQILEEEADKSGAIAAYETALRLRPEVAKWYYDLGKLQMEQGDKDYDKAIKTLSSCITLSRNIGPEKQAINMARWKRGKCFYLQGKNEEASADYRYFEENARAQPDAFYVDFANVLIRQRRLDEAALYLKKARETPTMLLTLGILNFLRSPTNESAYSDYFERSFQGGVSQDVVDAAPELAYVYQNCPFFKSRLKKYNLKANF